MLLRYWFPLIIQFRESFPLVSFGQIKCLTDCPASQTWQTCLSCNSGFPGSFCLSNFQWKVRSRGYWGGIPQTGREKMVKRIPVFFIYIYIFFLLLHLNSYQISFEIPGICNVGRVRSISKVFYSRVLWWFLRGNSSRSFPVKAYVCVHWKGGKSRVQSWNWNGCGKLDYVWQVPTVNWESFYYMHVKYWFFVSSARVWHSKGGVGTKKTRGKLVHKFVLNQKMNFNEDAICI